MQDMLVRLYDLPPYASLKAKLEQEGFVFKRPIAPEKKLLSEWVRKHFSQYWASEMEVALSTVPANAVLALYKGQVVGFACFETTSKAFFGPTGVLPDYRGNGLGKVLLFESLQALKMMGYAYGIIGGVGPADFYTKTVGAILIEGSNPGIYKSLLKQKTQNDE
ncbi:MAG: GNAT family N-acetyltransferase [Bacteroidota bacterium]